MMDHKKVIRFGLIPALTLSAISLAAFNVAAQDKAGVEQANLAKLQQQLFDLQREIATARVENENLEASIRSKEIGR